MKVLIEQELIDEAINKIKELEFKLIKYGILRDYKVHEECVQLAKKLEDARGPIRPFIVCKLIERNII